MKYLSTNYRLFLYLFTSIYQKNPIDLDYRNYITNKIYGFYSNVKTERAPYMFSTYIYISGMMSVQCLYRSPRVSIPVHCTFLLVFDDVTIQIHSMYVLSFLTGWIQNPSMNFWRSRHRIYKGAFDRGAKGVNSPFLIQGEQGSEYRATFSQKQIRWPSQIKLYMHMIWN